MGIAANRPLGASPTTALVEVRATGNVFIRRGPDLAFNAIGVLKKGAAAAPTGRDALSKWVRIALPDHPDRTGWLSIMTDFTEVSGEVQSLPEIEPEEWPALAFVRNCTFHEMVLDPGSLVVPAVQNFPDNEIRVNPGTYAVVDVDVDGFPQVLELDIREGVSISIVEDGNGEKRKCPAP